MVGDNYDTFKIKRACDKVTCDSEWIITSLTIIESMETLEENWHCFEPDELNRVIAFIKNYTEVHAILPCQIPGLKDYE